MLTHSNEERTEALIGRELKRWDHKTLWSSPHSSKAYLELWWQVWLIIAVLCRSILFMFFFQPRIPNRKKLRVTHQSWLRLDEEDTPDGTNPTSELWTLVNVLSNDNLSSLWSLRPMSTNYNCFNTFVWCFVFFLTSLLLLRFRKLNRSRQHNKIWIYIVLHTI